MRTSLRRLIQPAALLVPAALLALTGVSTAAASPVVPDLLASPGIVVSAGAPPLPTSITGESWLVADADTGAVLAARDAHGSHLPASTLKVLTAITLIPKLDPAARFQPSQEDLNVDGSKVGLFREYAYPVSTLFTAMLVVSANDAADTLATGNGGIAVTADQMNAEAIRLGATGTHAVNPSGLDAPGQRSTAYDLALFGRAGLALPDFRRYIGTRSSTVPGMNGKQIAIQSHDKLLFNYPGAIGIKNGYTVAAKATYIGAATRDGHTMIVTVMRAQPRIWPEVAALLDWGFAAQKAGVAPVGRLASPAASPAPAGASPAAIRTPSPREDPSSPPTLPSWVAALAISGMVIAFRIRSRRRGRRRR